DILESIPRYRDHNIYRDYPKFRQHFHTTWRWACLEAVTPSIGDAGATGIWGVVCPPTEVMLRAYQVYCDPDLARHVVRLLNGKLDSVHGSIFEAAPEALRKEVAAHLKTTQPPLESRLLDGYGLAILQTPQRENGRAL